MLGALTEVWAYSWGVRFGFLFPQGRTNDDAGRVCNPRHPDGLRLDLLGLVVEVGRVRIVADRAGLLGGLLASLTCGGAAAADRLEAMARVMRAEDGSGQGGGLSERQQVQAS